MQLKIWKKCGCKLSSQTFECNWSQSKISDGLATINGTNILFQAKKICHGCQCLCHTTVVKPTLLNKSCSNIKILVDLLPLCDTNIGTRDGSFLLEIRCLSNLLWLNHKIFLIRTNCIQKFENLACSHNLFIFLIAL